MGVDLERCPKDEAVAALARGELDAEAAARVQAHVDSCADCFGKFLRGGQADTGNAETGVLVGVPRWAEPEPAIDWKPGRDLGRYVLLQELGRGGMGVVFSAYDKELDRAVALKVLQARHDDGSTAGGQTRLLREAQAMARLSHPNVVAVHDVVVLEHRVCVVMELVEGSTVREWLKKEPRPWREVVAVFRAAGEGLAAAHAANLVHRDFKPDNLLIGKDGRVRVTDFGIARLGPQVGVDTPHTPEALEEGAPGSTPEAALRSTPASALATSITAEGAVVGTPRYMAPEQYRRGVADFRTDQFSLAVSLYEALYGQFPFAGKTAAERMAHAERGEVRPPPPHSKVPPAHHRLLQRALSADPAQRFGSMHELLVALAKDPAIVRRRIAFAASAVALAGLAIGFTAYQTRQRTALCTGAEARLAGVWDGTQREAIHAAFAKARVPFAEDSFQLAASALDGYASGWVRSRKDTCEATRVRGEQSEQVMTLRTVCLERRRDALSALTELFSRADPGVVGKAKQSIDALPLLSYCDDVPALSAAIPPPEDPAQRSKVDALRAELARGQMLVLAGRPAEAEAKARAVLAEGKVLGYVPVIAEAELLLGHAYNSQTHLDEAREILDQAFTHAVATGHWEVMTGVAVQLSNTYGFLNQADRRESWIRIGHSANAHRNDRSVEAVLLTAEGNSLRNAGEFTAAIARYDQAYTLAEKALGPDHMTSLGTRYNRATGYYELGRWREADADLVEIVAGARRSLGKQHPFLAYPLSVLGEISLARGRLADAKAAYTEMLGVVVSGTVNLDMAHEGLGDVAFLEGRLGAARTEYVTARALYAGLAADRPEAKLLDVRLALVDLAEGRPDRARKTLDALVAGSQGHAEQFDLEAAARRALAHLELAARKPDRALAQAEAAVALWKPKRGANHPLTLDARSLVAVAELELGRTPEALAAANAVMTDTLPPLGEDAPVAARAHGVLGRAALVQGDLELARRELGLAARAGTMLNPYEQASLDDAAARLRLASEQASTTRPLPTTGELRPVPSGLHRLGGPGPAP